MVSVMATSAPAGFMFPPISAVSTYRIPCPDEGKIQPLRPWSDRHALCSIDGSYRTNGSAQSVRFVVVGHCGGWWEGASWTREQLRGKTTPGTAS